MFKPRAYLLGQMVCLKLYTVNASRFQPKQEDRQRSIVVLVVSYDPQTTSNNAVDKYLPAMRHVL